MKKRFVTAVILLLAFSAAVSMTGCGKKEEPGQEKESEGFVSEEIEEELIEEDGDGKKTDEGWYWERFGTGEMKYKGTDRYKDRLHMTGSNPLLVDENENAVLVSPDFYEGAYSWIDDTQNNDASDMPYQPCFFRAEKDDAYPELSTVFINSAGAYEDDMYFLDASLYDLADPSYSYAVPETIVTSGPVETTIGDYKVVYTRTQYETAEGDYETEGKDIGQGMLRYPSQRFVAVVHIPLEKGEMKLGVQIEDNYKDAEELPDESILETVIGSIVRQTD